MKLKKYKDYFNKIVVFYKTDSANYWNSITPCRIEKVPEKIGRYYLDFSSKLNYVGKFDKNGIPLYRYGNSKEFYHPIVIAQYAFGLYELMFKNNFKDKKINHNFIAQADWLVNNIIKKDNISGWLVNYDIPDYRLKSPWFSAMAQGEAISILLRAHSFKNNQKYIETALQALDIFEIPVKNGGVVNYFEGTPIYEEYPSQYKTVGVLNGFIFSLFGLFDLWIYLQSEKAEKLFKIGIESLTKLIKFYDIGYWSQYYLFDYPKRYPASFTYHLLAAGQLKALYILTGEKIFDEYSKKWFMQSEKFLNKTRALINKLLYARKLSWSEISGE